jgi:hypothetical protein
LCPLLLPFLGLFNLRGKDIKYNPVFFSYAAVTSDSVHLFVDEKRLSVRARAHLTSHNRECEQPAVIHPYSKIEEFVAEQVRFVGIYD